MLAEADLVDGDSARAIKTLSRLARHSPDRADLRVRLGRACLAAGEIDLARTEAASATMLAPEDISAWQLLGEVAEAAGDDSGALDSYLRAAAIDGSDAGLSLRIAGLHQRGGDATRALTAVSHYLDRAPAGSPPYDGLLKEGELLIELGQTARAVERLSLATRHPSAGPESFVRLSQAQTRDGQPVEARQTLVAARERWPDERELDALLARMEAGPPPDTLASHQP